MNNRVRLYPPQFLCIETLNVPGLQAGKRCFGTAEIGLNTSIVARLVIFWYNLLLPTRLAGGFLFRTFRTQLPKGGIKSTRPKVGCNRFKYIAECFLALRFLYINRPPHLAGFIASGNKMPKACLKSHVLIIIENLLCKPLVHNNKAI